MPSFSIAYLTIKWIVYDDIRDLVINVYDLNRKQWFLCLFDVVITRLFLHYS